MRITYDPEADAAYIYLSENKISTTASMDGVGGFINLDLSSDGKICGIEVIPASTFLEKSLLEKAEVI